MKKRSLSHFAYYAANRAFPVFLLLLLLLGFTACSAEKGAKALDYPAMFGETKNEVLAALDAENLTYKEDDLYANAYVLDRTETLENLIFRSTCFSISTPIRFTATAGPYSSKTRPMRTASCPKSSSTPSPRSTANRPPTPASKTASPRILTA